MKTISDADLILLLRHAEAAGVPEGLTADQAMATLYHIKNGDITLARKAEYTDTEGNVIDTLDEGSKKLVGDLREVLDEAVAGEFGDFTNDKYPAPKIALVEKFETLKQNVINGNYD